VIHSRAVPLLDEAEDRVGVMQVIENIADKVFDPLTGVHNYRYYDELTAQEGYRATRYDTPLSLIALDLNRFKDVNDRFGHIKGDLVLRDVAQSLEHAVRESDHLCRIGGDEFAVLAPHTTFQEGQALAQRIEEAIAGEFAPFNLSIAAGVASYPKDTMDPKRLREIADRRLYRAKTLLGSSPPGQTPPAQDGR
jgi:diguanylate cyclase (GGDEF)-like protein